MNTSESTTFYAKLRDTRGIRVLGKVSVVTPAGAAKTETVQAVIWSCNGVVICSIFQTGRPVVHATSVPKTQIPL